MFQITVKTSGTLPLKVFVIPDFFFFLVVFLYLLSLLDLSVLVTVWLFLLSGGMDILPVCVSSTIFFNVAPGCLLVGVLWSVGALYFGEYLDYLFFLLDRGSDRGPSLSKSSTIGVSIGCLLKCLLMIYLLVLFS